MMEFRQKICGSAGAGASKFVGLVALLCLCAAPLVVYSQSAKARTSQEYRVKAAFLFNFIKFAEWPEAAFQSAKDPLVVGILGEDPFGSYIDDSLKDQMVAGRKIQITRFDSTKDAKQAAGIKQCHVLFVCPSENDNAVEIVALAKGFPVLTVADVGEFVNKGGVIGFYLSEGKVRFKINVGVAKAAKIKLSSKLLSLAEVVNAAE